VRPERDIAILQVLSCDAIRNFVPRIPPHVRHTCSSAQITRTTAYRLRAWSLRYSSTALLRTLNTRLRAFLRPLRLSQAFQEMNRLPSSGTVSTKYQTLTISAVHTPMTKFSRQFAILRSIC
jgi:hypothetical protein